MTYTVTYNGNGATGGTVPTDPNTYAAGQTITVMGNPGVLVKAGYSLKGWNTQADGSGPTYTPGQTLAMGAANLTLFAQWTALPTYTVTYDGNGSNGGTIPTDSGRYEQGQTVTVLGNTGDLVKTGCTFKEWNTRADGSGTAYAAGQTFVMGAADVSLYAQWTVLPTYGVTYSSNGASSGSVPIDSNRYYQSDTVTVLGNPGNLAKSGYTFAGWNQNCSGTGILYTQGQTFSMPAADVALCAEWTLVPTHAVTYSGNGSTGGTVPIDSTRYPAGQTVTVLGNPGNLIKPQSYFGGWNLQANGSGGSYSQGQTFVMGSSDVVLYAQWPAAKTVFATKATFSGAFGGPVLGIPLCLLEAQIAHLPTATYLPWVSDSIGNSPKVNFTHSSVPYVDALGNIIAYNWADLTSGSLRSPINRDATGALQTPYPVWTFTKPDGTPTLNSHDDNCLLNSMTWYNDCDPGSTSETSTPWMSTGLDYPSCITGSQPLIGDVGNQAASTGAWSYLGTVTCSGVARLYCFQQ
ncbi:MAG TPA: InlB B-repeat-containing protein [Anaeromyxobacter sp.]|nr:InlB B-repeat-containing protein [Anaeromyxobacter sp.]